MTDCTEQAQLVKDCEDREERLTDWQRGFIDSIGRQLEAGRSLSAKQSDLLDEVWTQATERG